jgi:hypothetical protein
VDREGHLQIGRIIIIATTIAYAALAGAGQENELERCARLDSDAERLACFDALTGQHPEPVEAPAAVAPPPEPAAAPEVESPPRAAEAPAPPPSETAVEDVQPPPPQNASVSEKRERPKEYTATVVAMRERPYGQKVVTLDNGEVWSEQFASRSFLVEVGDTVTMKSGRFSKSYRLVAPGGRGHKMTLLSE